MTPWIITLLLVALQLGWLLWEMFGERVVERGSNRCSALSR